MQVFIYGIWNVGVERHNNPVKKLGKKKGCFSLSFLSFWEIRILMSCKSLKNLNLSWLLPVIRQNVGSKHFTNQNNLRISVSKTPLPKNKQQSRDIQEKTFFFSPVVFPIFGSHIFQYLLSSTQYNQVGDCHICYYIEAYDGRFYPAIRCLRVYEIVKQIDVYIHQKF